MHKPGFFMPGHIFTSYVQPFYNVKVRTASILICIAIGAPLIFSIKYSSSLYSIYVEYNTSQEIMYYNSSLFTCLPINALYSLISYNYLQEFLFTYMCNLLRYCYQSTYTSCMTTCSVHTMLTCSSYCTCTAQVYPKYHKLL